MKYDKIKQKLSLSAGIKRVNKKNNQKKKRKREGIIKTQMFSHSGIL